MSNIEKSNYKQLVTQISDAFVVGQKKAVIAVSSHLVETYWKIGQYIVEYEQGGNERAEYGKQLLEKLSKDLSLLHGKGFSLSNMKRMRQFYQIFPISAMPSHQLTWSHYVELLKIDDPLERGFYEQQTLIENWSVAQLVRQKKTSLFLRLAREKDEYVIEYAMHNISSRLFVSKYQLYLPTKEELLRVIEKSQK
jgi:phosphopantetheine adenylyltransferase